MIPMDIGLPGPVCQDRIDRICPTVTVDIIRHKGVRSPVPCAFGGTQA